MCEAEKVLIDALKTALQIADMNNWDMVRFSTNKETVRQYLLDKSGKEEFDAHKTPIGKALDAGHVYR